MLNKLHQMIHPIQIKKHHSCSLYANRQHAKEAKREDGKRPDLSSISWNGCTGTMAASVNSSQGTGFSSILSQDREDGEPSVLVLVVSVGRRLLRMREIEQR